MQFRPYDPLQCPLHYQRCTLKDSYSPKLLHKIVLIENVKSSFFLIKNVRKVQKHVISLDKLANLNHIPTQRPLTGPTKYI